MKRTLLTLAILCCVPVQAATVYVYTNTDGDTTIQSGGDIPADVFKPVVPVVPDKPVEPVRGEFIVSIQGMPMAGTNKIDCNTVYQAGVITLEEHALCKVSSSQYWQPYAQYYCVNRYGNEYDNVSGISHAVNKKYIQCYGDKK